MKIVVINECESINITEALTFNLTQMEINDCIGCWSCWWKTPGRCTFHDLDEFYHQYITADKAIYFSKVTKGFVSGHLKTLFDRMIPLYLPYTTYTTGESMHVPRYEKYPDIEFYYEGKFESAAGHQNYVNYINRVFYQFYSKNITVKPIKEFIPAGGNNV